MTTDTTTTTTAGLTREDLAALRAADNLTFHHYRDGDSQPRHMIRAYLRGTFGQRIWTAREQRLFPELSLTDERMRTVAVKSVASGYERDGNGGLWSGEPQVRAFASHYIDNTIRTVLALLRTGDELTLQWRADNNTDNHRSVGFHADELWLSAWSDSPARDLTFHIAHSVGPDNTARMIRRHG